jgi:hypothetical protein
MCCQLSGRSAVTLDRARRFGREQRIRDDSWSITFTFRTSFGRPAPVQQNQQVASAVESCFSDHQLFWPLDDRSWAANGQSRWGALFSRLAAAVTASFRLPHLSGTCPSLGLISALRVGRRVDPGCQSESAQIPKEQPLLGDEESVSHYWTRSFGVFAICKGLHTKGTSEEIPRVSSPRTFFVCSGGVRQRNCRRPTRLGGTLNSETGFFGRGCVMT